MKRSIALVCLLAASLAAQTTGSFTTGDLTINGQGGGQASLVQVQALTSGFQLDYEAQNSVGAPFAIVLGSALVGSIPLGANSDSINQTVDLDLFSPFILALDGINSNPTSFLWRIPASGIFTVTTGAIPAAPFNVIQAVCTNPAAASGLDLTQAVEVTVNTGPFGSFDCSAAGGTNLGAGDDTSHLVNFTTGSFTFYGVNYTSCFVASNGRVTFNAGSADFSPSETEFLAQNPSIAPAWGDWEPNAQGEVRVLENAFGINIEWWDVPAWGFPNDSNSFCVRLNYSSGLIYCDFGRMDVGAGTINTIVTGVTPGGNLSLANNVDISSSAGVAPAVGGALPTDAVYEAFGLGVFSAGFDLGGDIPTQTVRAHDIAPTGGNGVGPYTINQL
ncbi:MAG TPA: hypothetical protein PKA37_06725 [Planctomycetota bacterium]|nr:hypothetical protein [Planctomycetota bacterium]